MICSIFGSHPHDPFFRTTTSLLHFRVFVYVQTLFRLFISEPGRSFRGLRHFFFYESLIAFVLFAASHYATSWCRTLPALCVHLRKILTSEGNLGKTSPANYWSFYCSSPDDSARIFPLCVLLTMRHCVGLENLCFIFLRWNSFFFVKFSFYTWTFRRPRNFVEYYQLLMLAFQAKVFIVVMVFIFRRPLVRKYYYRALLPRPFKLFMAREPMVRGKNMCVRINHACIRKFLYCILTNGCY